MKNKEIDFILNHEIAEIQLFDLPSFMKKSIIGLVLVMSFLEDDENEMFLNKMQGIKNLGATCYANSMI